MAEKQKRKKRFRRKKVIIAAGGVIIAAGVAGGVFLYTGKNKMPQMPQQKSSQATVARGEISNTIVGTGNLECDTAVSQKIPSGITVEEVNVESGDLVKKGQMLATVSHLSVLTAMADTQESIDSLEQQIENYEDGTDEDSTELEYEIMLAKKEALEATMEKLEALEEDGRIKAEYAGTVQNVYVSAGSDETNASASSSSGSGMTATGMSYMAEGFAVEVSEQNEETSQVDAVTAQELEQYIALSEEEESIEETKLQFSILPSGTSCAGTLVLETPKVGNIPQSQIVTSDGTYSGSIVWNMDQEVFQNGIVYQARVTLNAAEEYYFSMDSVQQLSVGIMSGLSIADEGKTLSFQITFPETEQKTSEETNRQEQAGVETEDEKTENNVENESEKDENTLENQTNPSNQNQNTNTAQQSSSDAAQSQSSQNQSTQSQSTQASSSVTAEDSSESSKSNTDTSSSLQYSTDTTAFTISGNEKVILSVNVDELDINSVSEGQQAEITFDAIEDETFTGTVTNIDQEASASNGVAKYGVDITLEKEEQMKVGMNASATIVIEEKKDVLTIPVNALQERKNEVFVYTSQSEDGSLSGEKTVKTGLSDGENVEITEGLSEGDTIYYQKTGNTSSSNNRQMGMPGGDMQMPGGSGSGMGDRGNFQKQGSMSGSQGAPPSM
ncbi:MAG: efflux RND transporter periplasmic adaptor subunit [Lachnospiraceae bacterium]|nr:efflux RND transporter periplasmic adaptor subunit [Lachnospiraceae bacterium]